MGSEKALTRTISGMLLEDRFPAKMPGPPSGTLNHRILFLVARTIWCWWEGPTETWRDAARGSIEFLSHPDFMGGPGTTEQLSPSHSSWWLTGVLALRWWAWEALPGVASPMRPDVQRVANVADAWLAKHHALCKLFATPVGIVAPGARAWPRPTGGKPYYGRCKSRDELYAAFERGKVRRVWAPSNLDMLSLVFADKLLKAGWVPRKKAPLPRLRWPISIQRSGDDYFSAWLTAIEGAKGLETQRLAMWHAGREEYGFDDAHEPVFPAGAERRVIGEGAVA